MLCRVLYVKWYVFPFVALAFVAFFCVFIALQLFYCDADWNFVTKILDAIAETTLGKSSDGYVFAVNGALFTFMIAVVIPNLWVKPWDKEKRDMDKQDRIEKYIKKNKLL